MWLIGGERQSSTKNFGAETTHILKASIYMIENYLCKSLAREAQSATHDRLFPGGAAFWRSYHGNHNNLVPVTAGTGEAKGGSEQVVSSHPEGIRTKLEFPLL
jgi:hypothetical protein